MLYRGKKVLVTGGTGFVGRHLVAELLKQGAKVRIPLHHRPLVIQDENIETIQADLNRREDCLETVKGVDYVFHAAGAVAAAAVTAGNPMAAMNANLILTAQMLEAAWSEGIDRFLLFSSSTGYPAADYPVKEDEFWSGPTHPAYFGYGWMRRYLERLGEFVASKSNINVAIVRPTAVYGPHDNFDPVTSHVIPALIRRAAEKQNPFVVWGTGEEIRDFLHIEDLARGCLLMLEKKADCDPVNIGYGKAIKIKEIVKTILDAVGHNDAELVFDSSKPIAIPVRMVDTQKAKRLLGFEPEISLEEGLYDMVRWYMQSVNKQLLN